jgi:DNA-binding HxlR family transcriptional regulator
VDSRASITTMLNWMVSFGLLERHEITDVRPMRTKYNVSKKGQSALNKIKSFDL